LQYPSNLDTMLGYVLNFLKALLISASIWASDYYPISWKRKKYAAEYSGEELEKRIRVPMFGGVQMFKNIFKLMNTVNADIKVGEPLPEDIKVYDLANSKFMELAKLCRPGIPLILNFGSCTWPPFMKSLTSFKKLCQEMTEVDSIIMYISEAHPTDGWRLDFPGQYEVAQPSKFEEKISCAKHLESVLASEHKFSPKIFVDQMDNRLSTLFQAHPERLAVIKDGKVSWIGGKGPFDYSIEKLREFLQKQI